MLNEFELLSVVLPRTKRAAFLSTLSRMLIFGYCSLVLPHYKLFHPVLSPGITRTPTEPLTTPLPILLKTSLSRCKLLLLVVLLLLVQAQHVSQRSPSVWKYKYWFGILVSIHPVAVHPASNISVANHTMFCCCCETSIHTSNARKCLLLRQLHWACCAGRVLCGRKQAKDARVDCKWLWRQERASAAVIPLPSRR